MMMSRKLILASLLWHCSVQGRPFSLHFPLQLSATSTTRCTGRDLSSRQRPGRCCDCPWKVRGGGGAEATTTPTKKKQDEYNKADQPWSWEVENNQNTPIKLAIGLLLFAVKAWDIKIIKASSWTFSPQPPPILLSLSKELTVLPPPPPPPSVTTYPSSATGTGTASMPALTFNLVKAIVGVGVLSLPAGIAVFGNAPSAVIPAIFLVVIMGVLSAIGFSWIAQVCAETGAPSYREAWARSVSRGTCWIPAWCAIGKTFTACISYSMVLADSLRAFIPIQHRSDMLWTVTAFVLLPLCWLKDLKSLVPFSILGVVGMMFTVLAMTYRYLHGSYGSGSPLLREVAPNLRPWFGKDGWEAVFRPQSIVFVSMLSSAYMCHFNSPRFYRELKNNTIPRLNALTALGFGIAILLSALTAGIGFLTFGSASDGMVLNNYAPNDSWIHLSRLAVSLSLIFSYPISFQGLRDGVLDIMAVPSEDRTDALLNQTTIGLLLTVTLLASILTDVSFVVAFGGATLGNLLVFVFPSLMFGRINPSMKAPAAALGLTGVALGLIGSFLSLKNLGKQ